MTATEANPQRMPVTADAQETPRASAPAIGLEQYYSEAGPDYAAWSPEFNMHFGYYRPGMNPFDREAMLEQMNAEVLARLHVPADKPVRLLDLGCGLGATLRSLAKRLPQARLLGVTRVPWQVEQANARNAAAGVSDRVTVVQGDYEDTILPRASYDAVYALESSCHAHGEDKEPLLAEAWRLLKPGGRIVIVDGFLERQPRPGLQERIYRKLCECWVIEQLAVVDSLTARMRAIGFQNVQTEPMQFRVAPSVAHVPWVTIKFLLRELFLDRKPMTRARWNNVLAPLLLPWVSWPLGPMAYVTVTATKPTRHTR